MAARRYVLTMLVVACILGAGFFISQQFADPRAGNVAFVTAGLFALALIRSSLIKPFLVTRRWLRYAADHGHKAVIGKHGEPRMIGDLDGVRFIVAQSTSLLGGSGGYYARTVVTAPIEGDVPDGLRVYRRDALEWMHQLSGLREVEVGDPDVDARFMVEGSDAVATRAWVLERLAIVDEFAEKYPRFIAYGSEIDGLPVAAGGANGAVTLIVVGRLSTAAALDDLITDACRFANVMTAPDAA